MTLAAGTKLGPYEILCPLGAGGMGEVYRARDTRLDRDVAVKVLPATLSSDPNLRQRLEREAKAVSKLSHAHICTLYDIGHQDGTDFLVMELLEGETLEQRLTRGALPPEQTVRYAAQIADALAKAHRKGLTHRDLKPANIMLTKSGAKLMDFGLAKESGPTPLAAALTEMTLEQAKLTSAGTIVGTFQYMAPEQLEGKEADARTDIFALGELIHEMATGKPAFSGKSRASLIAAILTTEPAPISQLQPMTPVALEHLVKKCLAKDPDERWQSANDLASELDWISQSSAQAAEPARRQAWRSVGFGVAAGAAVLFAALAGIQYWRMRTAIPTNFEFYVTAPEKTTLDTVGLAGTPVISPDGRTIAFLATTTDGVTSLWARPLDSTEPHPLPETENATYPFWSPDSRLLAFFAGGQLKKIAINGGMPIAICAATEGRGGAWSDLGFILIGLRDGGLQKVSAAGGSPVTITQLDRSKSEASHRFPVLLPDDDHYLFVVQAGHPYLSGGSLKSGRRLADFPDIDSSVAYNQGNLLFVRGTTLFAQAFDPVRLQFSGDQVALAEKVQTDSQFNFGVFSVSRDGELVFQGGATALSAPLLQLDRTGKQLGSVPGTGRIWTIGLSPSGTQLLAEIDEATAGRSAIWLFDLVAGTRARLTFNDWSGYPVWSHDGREMAFNVGQTSNEMHVRDLASGGESTVFSEPGSGSSFVGGWSPDDRYVFYDLHRPGANWEIWVAESAGQHNRYPWVQATGDARWARLSPDGKWLAYAGGETGRPEIYVVPVDFTGARPKAAASRSQISTDGGNLPVWARDGKELFFTNAAGTTLYTAPFTTANGMVHAGTAKKLFDLSIHSYAVFYDVSPDGKKFYVAEAPPGSSPPLTVVTNWQARIKK